MNRRGRLLFSLLPGLILLCLASLSLAPALQAATAVVADDGNNLRAWAGDNYKQAPILQVLNRGDYVRVWSKKGAWAQVSTPEGIDGWVHAGCLREAPDRLAPQDLPPALRDRLQQFLQQLRAAAQSRNFPQLASLIAPGGLILAGRVFKDAGLDPGQQAPVLVPLWYATDVSLTRGTAWQLLMAGTRPPPARAFWDDASNSFQLGTAPAGKETFPLEKQGPLLPAHLEALQLAPVVRLVGGYPGKLTGFPESDDLRFEPQKTPFAWVFQVGPERYLLMPLSRLGLHLVVTDRAGEGLRLKAVFSQSP